MQTIPIATTSPTGQAPQPSAAAKSRSDASIFAALIQALTGTPAASTAPATAVPGELDGEAAAATAEGETPVEDGADIDIATTAQLAGMVLPVPPPTAPAFPQVAYAAGAGTPAPQPAAGMPESPPLPAAPAAAATEAQPAVPPSAQAVELAKVLGTGTQVHVTTETAAPSPPAPAASTVAVALALQDAPAAAQPLIRTLAQEPKKTSAVAGVASAGAGEAVKTAPTFEPAAMLPERPAPSAQQKAEAAPTPAAADADGAPATPAPPSSLGSALQAQPEATAPEPAAAAAKGSESQAPAPQPAFAGTAGAQPAAAPERAAPPMFPAPYPAAGQVSVHIAKAVRAGVDRIDIQLAPASLGRVEISLDLSDSQQVRATISAETKEALELLRADARVLERALNDAGLKTDPGSLSFQLRDQGTRAGHDGGSRQGYPGQPHGRLALTDGEGTAAEPSPRPAPPSLRAHGRIDIHA